MTLCELRTAEFHSIPLECEVFSEEGGLSDRAPHGICVEWVYLLEESDLLLSHTEHFPGVLSLGPVILAICVKFVRRFLSELPFSECVLIAQLCFAYQRSNEKGAELEQWSCLCALISEYIKTSRSRSTGMLVSRRLHISAISCNARRKRTKRIRVGNHCFW